MTTHRNALELGTRIDRYEIEAVIGHGGFGISYRAVDVGTGETVALKEFLPTELATRDADDSVHPLSESHLEDFQWGLERFLDEVKLLSRFHHPGIVRVHRAFEGNGTAYMVMAYEKGESLATRLKREGTLDAAALMDLIIPLLEGLEIVHDAGFIHRDIKPSNIYLRRDGGPVLLDFGSARQALRGKTRTLTALVSAGYAPLEQYFSRSDLQGPWSDIYGLGATLYEAVSGDAPIDAVERSRGVLGSTRDILTPAAEVATRNYPPCVLAAIDHALCMEDQDRPRSIAEWRRELTGEAPVPEAPQTTLARPETEATVRGRRAASPLRDRPGLATLVAVLLLAIGSLAWWQWSGMRDAIDNRIADPRPRAAGDPPERRLVTLRESLTKANAATDSSRKQIENLTARLAELEAARAAPAGGSDNIATPQPATNDGGTRAREQDVIITELRTALEAAQRSSDEARRQAAELAARVKLLEAVRATDDTESESRRKEIDGLLAAADADMRRLRLTTPAGSNAHERYLRVLALDEDNPDARRGLERIVAQYIAFATGAQNQGDIPKATRFLDRASGVLPGYAPLTSARERLAAAVREQEQDNVPVPAVNGTDDRGTAVALAPTPAVAGVSAPRPGRPPSMAVLPTDWASGTTAPHNGPGDILAASLGTDILDALVQRSEFVILYDYREASENAGIPDSSVLWQGDAVRREPNADTVYQVGERLDVDTVLMWRARPVVGFGSWPVDLYLVDIVHGRRFHVAATNREIVESVDRIVDQYLNAVREKAAHQVYAAGTELNRARQTSPGIAAGASPPPASLPKVVTVDARANGHFGRENGSVDAGSRPLVEAYVFTRPSRISLEASGRIDLNPGKQRLSNVGPDGLSSRPRGPNGCRLPLDEAIVRNRGVEALATVMRRAGALFGAFVPGAVADGAAFRAISDDFPSGGISSRELFLVGTGVEYAASEPGTLFLGINDCRPSNNLGAFSVVVSSVE